MISTVLFVIFYYGYKAKARFPEGLEPGFDSFKDEVPEEEKTEETETESYEQA